MYEERAQSCSRDGERHFYFIEALESARLLLSAPDVSDHTAKPDPSDGPAISKPQSAAIQTDALANRFAMLEVEEAADTPDIAVEPPAQKAPSLLVGETVIIEGVVSKPELNGCAGRILQYAEGRGRYDVDVDGQQYCQKPSNTRVSPVDITVEERYLLGETVQVQAACLPLDIEGVLREVRIAWDEHRHGRCSLLEASARTNACVRHAERLASAVELDMPTLNSLERVVCAAYLMHTISWTQRFLKVSFAAALNLVSDITHGIPGDTVLPTLGGTRVIFGVELFARSWRLGSLPTSSGQRPRTGAEAMMVLSLAFNSILVSHLVFSEAGDKVEGATPQPPLASGTCLPPAQNSLHSLGSCHRARAPAGGSAGLCPCFRRPSPLRPCALAKWTGLPRPPPIPPLAQTIHPDGPWACPPTGSKIAGLSGRAARRRL